MPELAPRTDLDRLHDLVEAKYGKRAAVSIDPAAALVPSEETGKGGVFVTVWSDDGTTIRIRCHAPTRTEAIRAAIREVRRA